MAVITCLYGESVTTSLTNAPDGIEASLVVNVLAPDGVTVVWTTTGVTDAGTGLYTQVIPVTWSTTGHEVTAGTISYLIQWVYGATSATDQLEVTPATTIVAGDLCSLAQVKRDPTLGSIGSTRDTLISELITQVSRQLQVEMGRWVVQEDAATRTFNVGGHHRTRRVPVHDLQGAPSNVNVTVDGTTTSTAVAVTALPVDRVSGDPITGLEFPAGVLTRDARIVVTGDWGWPGGVPVDIQHAAVETVILNLRRRNALTSASPDQDEYAPGPQLLFPASALQVIRWYRRPGIA